MCVTLCVSLLDKRCRLVTVVPKVFPMVTYVCHHAIHKYAGGVRRLRNRGRLHGGWLATSDSPPCFEFHTCGWDDSRHGPCAYSKAHCWHSPCLLKQSLPLKGFWRICQRDSGVKSLPSRHVCLPEHKQTLCFDSIAFRCAA